MAMLSQATGAKLVLTLTPDPHRTMVDKQGYLKSFTPEETMDKLNKINIGDELLTMAHGVLGIGGMAIKKDLKRYFPQLKHETRQFVFKMIGEEINTETVLLDFDVREEPIIQSSQNQISDQIVESTGLSKKEIAKLSKEMSN